MINLRKLAERIDTESGCEDDTYRILREHHEELQREMEEELIYSSVYNGYAVLYSTVLRVLKGSERGEPGEGETTAEPTLGPAAPDLREVVERASRLVNEMPAWKKSGFDQRPPITLEVGGRATSEGQVDPAGSSSSIQEPAAPDQPHEYKRPEFNWWGHYPHPDDDLAGCRHPGCNRQPDDPNHQTNEVSDERRSPSPVRDVQEQGLGGSTAERPIPRVSEVLEHHGSNWEGASGDQPQVTNYDVEAETRAREGVWVGPGDEVWTYDDLPVTVIGTDPDGSESLAVCFHSDGDLVWYHPSDLRTPTGQPVLGFREREAPLDGDRLVRIAELERELGAYKKEYGSLADDYQRTLRERDEARAERDDMHKMLIQFKGPADWVRLDDATIERVFHEINQGAGTLYDDVIRVLRSLRDGKLKEASDADA